MLGTGVTGVAVLGTGVTGAGVLGALVAATGEGVVGRGVMGAGAWLGTWDSKGQQVKARYGSENRRRAVLQGVVGVSACAPHLTNASWHALSPFEQCMKHVRAEARAKAS